MAGGNTRTVGLLSGLHLLLAGFDEESQNQLVEEISEKGGQIAERYDSSCTHVIVCNLPANDTVCCAARKDGKVLVTDMWITDCLETDTLVDVNNVLYRPLKDLAGIAGSDSLCICLTGYQGLARKKIMRMVEMMGAKFSKPLIGSVVTHLICYKFEGEKYELAKKTGMFLVNQFWLEDSLNSWTLLPVSSYARSGWEAETLRAQENTVEDSGEEDTIAEDDSTYKMKSSWDNVSPAVQSPSEKGGSPIVDDDLNSHRKSKSRHSLSPSATETKVRKVGSAIDCIADGSDDIMRPVQIGALPDPSAEDLPVEAGDNENGGSIPDAGEEESTRMYVEDGDENEYSCGRTSHEVAQDQSDSFLDKLEVSEPADAIDTTCHKMEVMGFATEYTTWQRSEDSKSAPGDENYESPGTKRRRRSHIVGNDMEPVLEKSFPMNEEAKDATDLVMEENETCAGVLNQDPSELAVSGSTTNGNIPAPSVDPGFSSDELPRNIEECGTKTSFDIGEPAMVISSPEAEHPARDIQSAQWTPTGIPSPMEEDRPGTDMKPLSQVRPKKSTTGARPKKKAKRNSLKNNASSNNTRPVSLKQIARSYNPVLKKKSGEKNPSPIEDKENHIASEDDEARQKGDQKKRQAIEGKENHCGNDDGQSKQHTASVRKNAPTKKPSESGMASALQSSKMCFAVGGSTANRLSLHNIVKMMGGKISKSRYQWRDETTHLILPGPLRRTEKFLAGAAAGRWILKPEYLEASRDAGKFLEEEAYEWVGEGTNDKGSVSLQAPSKWRKWVANSGTSAFQGLRVLFYGECISPPLDTMKRAIKAGGGVVVATTPPYTRHLADGVNFAVISPGIPKEDPIVEEFLKHEVACVLSDYLVDWVCHPSSSLDKYILYGTEKAASQHHEVIAEFGIRRPSLQYNQKCQEAKKTELETDDDVKCSVCGKFNDEAVMLLCGDGKGKGCGEGLHIYCCVPPLQNVPDDDWFCPKCQ